MEKLLVELLAIKLHEQDVDYAGNRQKNPTPWAALCVEDRETYRDMARAISDSRGWEPYSDKEPYGKL